MSTLKVTNIQHPSAESPAIELDATDGVVFSAASFDAAAITSGVLDAARVPLPPEVAGIGSNVVSTTKTDTFATSSTTFTDVTGLTATITPSSDTAKVFVTVSLTTYNGSNTANEYRLLRGSTPVFVHDSQTFTQSIGFPGGMNDDNYQTLVFTFLDSPNAATAQVYKVDLKTSAGTLFVNRSGNGVYLATSTITLIEVAP